MFKKLQGCDYFVVLPVAVLIIISIFVLKTLRADLFPQYYFYIITSVVAFAVFKKIGFEILSYFSPSLYVFSILVLLATYLMGSVTRGTVRWLSIGPLSIQPSELVRPLLLIFFGRFLVNNLAGLKKHVFAVIFIALPVLLIAIQPSLGVSLITLAGLTSMYLYRYLNKKNALILLILLVILMPFGYAFLKPYQKDRLSYFVDPEKDPRGLGYNTIQSIISVGSGEIFGKGLGKGVQTQLRFLPESHTDFVFASISEELGLLGGSIVLVSIFVLLHRLIVIAENSSDQVLELYSVGVFTVIFVETLINVGMNIGILPITGVPLPLISAGGSSLLATMISLSLLSGGLKKFGA